MFILYLSGAIATGMIWLIAFLSDQSTPKSDLASWAVLSVAIAAWPLVLPLSCLERLSKPPKHLCES